MKYKQRISFLKSAALFLFFFSFHANAQVILQPTEVGTRGEPTGFVLLGSGNFSDKIPYYRIKGSPFWNDEYRLATLYSANQKIKTLPVRLNLASNEIYFLDANEEFVLINVEVTKLVFHKGTDTATVSTTFIKNVSHLLLYGKPVEGFLQVLNPGNNQLLKYMKRTVGSADSLFRTQKRYFFKDDIYYFMQQGPKVERVKKLNEDNILPLLPVSSSYKKWITENKIDLKKETDVIRFLNEYNTTYSVKER